MSAAAARLRVVLVLAVAAAAVLVGAGAAQAHNTLVSTDPVDGSTVAAAPARVTLTFDEPARSLGTEVVVTAPDGTTVSTGDAVLDGVTVSQAVTGVLPAGRYAVTWRVTSADGHPLEGVLSFTATGPAAAGPAATGTTIVGVDPAATGTPTPSSAPTPSDAAPAAAASMEPVAPTGGSTIAPAGADLDAGGGLPSGVVLAGVAALVVVGVVAGAVLVRRRRPPVQGSPAGRVAP